MRIGVGFESEAWLVKPGTGKADKAATADAEGMPGMDSTRTRTKKAPGAAGHKQGQIKPLAGRPVAGNVCPPDQSLSSPDRLWAIRLAAAAAMAPTMSSRNV